MASTARQMRVGLGLCLVFLLVAGTAMAAEFQTTQPDACSVLHKPRLAPLMGAGVQSHANKFPLPELPAGDNDLNHFLKVSETQCTWTVLPKKPVSPSQIEALVVNVLERNDAYSGGGEPWDASREALILTAIGTGQSVAASGYRLVANDALAKKLHQPQLSGEDVFILVDRRSGGAKKAILGFRDDDNLWFYFGATTHKLRAIDLLIAATKHVLGG